MRYMWLLNTGNMASDTEGLIFVFNFRFFFIVKNNILVASHLSPHFLFSPAQFSSQHSSGLERDGIFVQCPCCMAVQ